MSAYATCHHCDWTASGSSTRERADLHARNTGHGLTFTESGPAPQGLLRQPATVAWSHTIPAPKGYSPLRRWLRQCAATERTRAAIAGWATHQDVHWLADATRPRLPFDIQPILQAVAFDAAAKLALKLSRPAPSPEYGAGASPPSPSPDSQGEGQTPGAPDGAVARGRSPT